jgi:hypothetical protein
MSSFGFGSATSSSSRLSLENSFFNRLASQESRCHSLPAYQTILDSSVAIVKKFCLKQNINPAHGQEFCTSIEREILEYNFKLCSRTVVDDPIWMCAQLMCWGCRSLRLQDMSAFTFLHMLNDALLEDDEGTVPFAVHFYSCIQELIGCQTSEFPSRPRRVYRGSNMPIDFFEFFVPGSQFRCTAFLSVTRSLQVALNFLESSRIAVEEVDGLDCRGRWWQAFVIKRTAQYFVLHFMGWEARWDETIPNSNTRTHIRARNHRSPVGPLGTEKLEDIAAQVKGAQSKAATNVRCASLLVLWVIDISNVHHQSRICSFENITEKKDQQHYFILPYTSYRVISSAEVQPRGNALVYRQIHLMTTEGDDKDIMVSPWH